MTLIIILIVTRNNKEFNYVDYEQNNSIVNRIDIDEIEWITHHSLNEVGLRGYALIISNLSPDLYAIFDGYSMQATIYQVQDSVYYMQIRNNLSINEYLTIIPHEIIHMQQFADNRLVLIEPGIVEFDKKRYVLEYTNYNNRPWEREAVTEGLIISNKLYKQFYQKPN